MQMSHFCFCSHSLNIVVSVPLDCQRQLAKVPDSQSEPSAYSGGVWQVATPARTGRVQMSFPETGACFLLPPDCCSSWYQTISVLGWLQVTSGLRLWGWLDAPSESAYDGEVNFELTGNSAGAHSIIVGSRRHTWATVLQVNQPLDLPHLWAAWKERVKRKERGYSTFSK